jgi:hypothetical protein
MLNKNNIGYLTQITTILSNFVHEINKNTNAKKSNYHISFAFLR